MAGVVGLGKEAIARLGDILKDPMINPILLAIALVLLSTVLILLVFLINSRKTKRQGVLLLGLCDSGKTLLFSLLTQKKKVLTHTSIRENQGKYEVKDGKKAKHADIYDLPGHERIRNKYIKKYEDMARGIVFMVDSASFQRQVRDIAEYMYDIFTNRTLMTSKPCILLACNKQDLPTARSFSVIKNQLEKEIEAMRFTRAAALKGTDDAQSLKNLDVGKKGKSFEFGHLSSKVEFVECDLTTSSTDLIENWIEKIL